MSNYKARIPTCGQTYCFGSCHSPAEYKIKYLLDDSEDYCCKKHLGEALQFYIDIGQLSLTTVTKIDD